MDIFVIRIEDANNVNEDLLKEFQKKEISNEKKRKTHCFSYFMVDRILREVYKIENRKIIFKENKPILKSGEKHFSISHSGEYTVLGFSDCNCGIDIEKVNNKRDWKAIAERMDFKSQSEEEFYKDWTKYEAEYKLRGKCIPDLEYTTSKKQGGKYESVYQTKIDSYALTAVSENSAEKFELYIKY